MKSLSFLFFLIPCLTLCQNLANGVGIITLNENGYSEENRLIQLLNEDGSVWYEFTFFYDDSDGEWDYPNEELEVISFRPDYFVLRMRCLKEDDSFYTVMVNEQTLLSKKVKKSSALKLESWETYVLNSAGVSFESISNPLLIAINGEKYSGGFPEFTFFQPVEIKGEWLKVKWATNGTPTADSEYKYGWIKWKSHNGILVYIFHYM